MPRVSKCDLLPEEVKKELNQRLVNQGFGGYCELSDWLEQFGYEISKSSIHRYGQEFKSQLEAIKLATEQAKAIAEVCEDDGNLLGDTLSRMAQQKAFVLLQEIDPDPETESFSKIVSAISSLNRSTIGNKQHLQAVRAKTKATADEVDQIAKQGGLTAQTAEEIRRKILGISD